LIQNNDVNQNDNVQLNEGHDDEQMMDDQESMVMHPSGNSSSSVNFHQGIGNNLLLHIGFISTTVYGHKLPPLLQWKTNV
jgi:hypothetical protein